MGLRVEGVDAVSSTASARLTLQVPTNQPKLTEDHVEYVTEVHMQYFVS